MRSLDPRKDVSALGQIVQGYAGGKDLEPYMFGHETNKGYGNSLTAPVDITSIEYADHLLL